MKLHLPGKLRAALLATFAFVSLAPVSAAPAEFNNGYAVQSTSREQADFASGMYPHVESFFYLFDYVDFTAQALEENVTLISFDSFDVNGRDWTLTLNSSQFNQYRDKSVNGTANSHWTCLFSTSNDYIGSGLHFVADSTSWYYSDIDMEGSPGDIGLFIAPKGKVTFYVPGKKKKLLDLVEDGYWESASFDITLSWNATEKTFTLTKGTFTNKDGQEFTIEDKELISADDEWTWRDNLFTNDPSSSWWTATNGGLGVLTGDGSNLTYTLIAPDAALQAWLVSGTSYMGSEYGDVINSGTRVMNLSSTEDTPADSVQFIGTKGVVMTDKDAVFDADFTAAPSAPGTGRGEVAHLDRTEPRNWSHLLFSLRERVRG